MALESLGSLGSLWEPKGLKGRLGSARAPKVYKTRHFSDGVVYKYPHYRIPAYGNTSRNIQTRIPAYGITSRNIQSRIPAYGNTSRNIQTRIPAYGITSRNIQPRIPAYGNTPPDREIAINPEFPLTFPG